MDNAPDTLPSNDADSSLLEGLFQLAVNGQTSSSDFELIDHEVYARLLSAYGGDKRYVA